MCVFKAMSVMMVVNDLAPRAMCHVVSPPTAFSSKHNPHNWSHLGRLISTQRRACEHGQRIKRCLHVEAVNGCQPESHIWGFSGNLHTWGRKQTENWGWSLDIYQNHQKVFFLSAFLALLALNPYPYLYLPVSHLLQMFVFWTISIVHCHIYSIGLNT